MTILAPGSKLGSYEIVARIGGGGMGVVYSAKNRVTEELRAIKVMLPELASQKQFVARFVREIKLTSSLTHPNLVRVYEPGIDGDCVFLPMELLAGETLADRIRNGGRLPEAQTLALLLAVGSAVLALHQAGILHRDLKPSNIFLAREKDGAVVPKVLDFGAAKARHITEEQTATGMAIGSPHYMAYEQASGVKDVDERVDQYSLAVVGYHALTGVRPFENDDTGSALAKLLAGAAYKAPRELVPQITEDVEKVLLRAMSRERDKRFSTLKDFLAALETSSPHDPTLMVVTSSEASGEATRFAPIAGPLPTSAALAPRRAHPHLVLTEATTGPVSLRSTPESKSTLLLLGALLAIGLAAAVASLLRQTGTSAASTRAGDTSSASAAPPPAPSPQPPSSTPAPPAVADTSPPSAEPPPQPAVVPVSSASIAARNPAPPVKPSTPKRPPPSAETKPSAAGAAAPCVPAPGVPCL